MLDLKNSKNIKNNKKMTESPRRKFFLENGFYIEKGIFNEKCMEELFVAFYDLCWSTAIKSKIKLTTNQKHPKDVLFPEDMEQLDALLLSVFNYDKSLIGEIYDTIAYCSSFMRFLGNKDVENLSRELLNLPKHTVLYGWQNRVRIDPPRDERRTYSWHQEIFYTIPETHFLQTWCPILRNTTKENGTIKVMPKSHKEGIAKCNWTKEEGRPLQIIVEESVTNKYDSLDLEMEIGDLLFFDGHLIHRSGTNSTRDEVRFSLVGMWHNTNYESFKAPCPDFKSKTISPEEYFKKTFKK
tara:strand:- start:6224 stop:7114 length:891 start_codon:yes stop_codon:yes gene_type:complete